MTAPDFHILVPAAGVGTRFGGDRPKQYQAFLDETLLDHTLGRLLDLGGTQPVLLGLSSEDAWWPQSCWSGRTEVKAFKGGSTRLQTVAAGLQQLQAADDDWVLIHDAVRPCVSRAILQPLFDAMAVATARNIHGIAPGEPVNQAVKRVDEAGLVTQVVERAGLWQTQTPQAFRLGSLRRAVDHCLVKNLAMDDEMAALHELGFATQLVAGHPANIKVTRPGDMGHARRMWQLL